MCILETHIGYRMEDKLDGGQISKNQKNEETAVIIQSHHGGGNGREGMSSGDLKEDGIRKTWS